MEKDTEPEKVEEFNIPIYCLSFPNSDRRKRMSTRFEQLGIESFIFQDPIPTEYPLVDYYLRNREDDNTQHGRRAASITISYIYMIKRFLCTGREYGVFCEDDVHIRKTFKKDLPEIIKAVETLKKKPTVILLGYLSVLNHFPLYDTSLKKINGKYKLMEYPDDVWGAQMILLSRKNAMDIVEKYDRPFYLSCPGKAYSGDHTFTKDEPRALVYPMLAVEEGEVSNNDITDIYFHKLCHQVNYNKDYI